MAITTKERTELRQELVGQGYSWNYIDEWQPKVTLHRHRATYNPNGEVVHDVGSKLENLPGNPDYVSRKARIGLFPWPPSVNCTCHWCARTSAAKAEAREARRVPKNPGPYYDANNS